MKTKQTVTKTRTRTLWISFLTVLLGTLLSGQVHGQIYVANNLGTTIGEYNLDGTTINSSLVSGLSGPVGVVVSGGNLFVVNQHIGTIGEYNATTGATINASFITGLGVNGPTYIALSGGNLFVSLTAVRSVNTTPLPGRQSTPR
jgi:hypothetical protein